jgi:hypothetical protein
VKGLDKLTHPIKHAALRIEEIRCDRLVARASHPSEMQTLVKDGYGSRVTMRETPGIPVSRR